MKFLIAVIGGAMFAAACSSCGFSAGGMTVGTTSYLQEANRGRVRQAQVERLYNEDRQALNDLIAARTQ